MIKTRKCWLALCAVLWSGIVHADVYEWLDALGRNHYSDRGHPSAQLLKIKAEPQTLVVNKVYDGDTLLLNDGRKVRFLGVNTPEIAGRNKSAEAGGEQAKAWLKQMIEHKRVILEFDVEKQDKYQRTLAHVFTEDHLHLNLELVRRGFAAANIFPPNLKYVDILGDAQQQAEQQGLGIWANPAYSPKVFTAIDVDDYKGWRRIVGEVKGVKTSRKYSYLKFSDRFMVQIPNQALTLFPNLNGYVGKRIEVRGWISQSKSGFMMRVRHPLDIKRPE